MMITSQRITYTFHYYYKIISHPSGTLRGECSVKEEEEVPDEMDTMVPPYGIEASSSAIL